MFKGEFSRPIFSLLRFAAIVLIATGLSLTGCRSKAVSEIAPNEGYPSANNLMQPGADDGQWPMSAKDYANTRFSGLDQINASNVANLKVAWTFSTGVDRGQEA